MLLGIGCVNILRALAATFAERLTTTERALGKELYYTYEKNRDYEAIVRILFTSKDYEKACQLLKDLRSVEVGKPTNLVTSSDDMERKNPKYTWEKEPVYGDQLQIHYSSQKEQLLCFKGQDVIYDSLKHGQDKREFFKLYEELRNRKTISFIVEAQYSEDDKLEKTTTSTVSMIVNEEEKREAFRLALHYLFEEVIFSVVNCTFDFSTLISNIRDNIKQLRRPGDQEIEHGDLDSKAKALLLQIGVSNVCKDWNKDRKEAAYKSILSKLEECYKDGEQKMNEMEHIKKGIQKACLQFHRVLNKKCGNSDEMTKATAVYNAFCNCSQIELQGAEQHVCDTGACNN
ncbi:hypothetical protein QR680_015259 [Steinernema hermaphroditum]|uniref:Uncharacterized protein n=1 Tax=Steinernema hermaphroditum TaxID=289476 RepID=A0AA39H739_9BILA|nr:hypothetical protein QR680_015259 [Steinernema hermaphroditum]